MTRSRLRSGWLRLPLIAAIVVVGCGKSDQVKPDSVSGASPVTRASEDTVRPLLNLDSSAVAQLAARTSYGKPREPVSTTKSLVTNRNHGVKNANKPSKITIETANDASTTGAHLIARIKSTGAYHDLGLENGDNYLYVLKLGSNQWVYLVSMSPFRITELTRDPSLEPYSHQSPEEPRIVYSLFDSTSGTASQTPDMIAYAFCVEDGACGAANHCGYNVY